MSKKKVIKWLKVDIVKGIQKLNQAQTTITVNIDKQQTCPFKTKEVADRTKGKKNRVITGCNKRLHCAHVSPLLHLYNSLRGTRGSLEQGKRLCSLHPTSTPANQCLQLKFVPTSETSLKAACLFNNIDVDQ